MVAPTVREAARRARASVGRRLPERVRYTIWQRIVPRVGLGRTLGHRVPAAIDTARAAEIDAWPRSELTDPLALAGRLAELGINTEFAPVLPESLRARAGAGLQCSQYPSQLAPYLIFLSGLDVSSYLEIGVDHGGTFLVTTRYLNRFRPLERAVAVDRFDIPALRTNPGPARSLDVLKLDSGSRGFARYLAAHEPVDLALIDGDHSEDRCRADFELVRHHARIIALHDIVGANTPGVRAVWRWIRETCANEFDLHEFTDQYPEVEAATGERYMGLGVAVRARHPA